MIEKIRFQQGNTISIITWPVIKLINLLHKPFCIFSLLNYYRFRQYHIDCNKIYKVSCFNDYSITLKKTLVVTQTKQNSHLNICMHKTFAFRWYLDVQGILILVIYQHLVFILSSCWCSNKFASPIKYVRNLFAVFIDKLY